MDSISGSPNPSRSDISKLVSFFRLNHEEAIINNHVTFAYYIHLERLFEEFCGV